MPSDSSNKIKKIIKESGITQVHLAKKLGVTPQHLNKILERNQQKGEYIPKISKILGVDIPLSEESSTTSISILSEIELASLAIHTTFFENLEITDLPCWPDLKNQDYYQFAYKIKEKVNFNLLSGDTVIFSTCIPLKLEKKIGLAFIKDKSLFFVGTVKYNQGKIIIYNDNDFYLLSSGDLLLGVAIFLERNIAEGLT